MNINIPQNVIDILNKNFAVYNHIDFIELDPISIPHKFSLQQDIEISGFLTALISWGNRKNIIKSAKLLMQMMDNNPYEFVMNFDENSSKKMSAFYYRTFNGIDLINVLTFLHFHYKIKKNKSLETAFAKGLQHNDPTVENALNYFYQYVFSTEIHTGNYDSRTQKHIAAPCKKTACKRLNMFLRWMVRKDNAQVDFGLWTTIKSSQLIIPLDVHVLNIANNLKLIENNKANWNNAVALTNVLKQLDANDPVKFDYALFSLGIANKTTI
jgi:uncharacterized protein (TIGR02757 family)